MERNGIKSASEHAAASAETEQQETFVGRLYTWRNDDKFHIFFLKSELFNLTINNTIGDL